MEDNEKKQHCVCVSRSTFFTKSFQKETDSLIENRQTMTDKTLTLLPVFNDDMESFDNEDLFPDLDFVIKGLKKPLLLHKSTLAKGSLFIQKIMRCKQIAESDDKDTIEWPFDTKKAIDRQSLVKALRFIYGDTLVVGMKDGECCAMISTFIRLQLTHLDEVITKLVEFSVKHAMEDVKNGAELLIEMQEYPECCDGTSCELEQLLVDIVLTSKNICEHHGTVVDRCLMTLPPHYLDIAEFGPPHSQFSEFQVRAQYVRAHNEELSMEEKQAIMMKCDWTKLESAELKELEKLGVVDQCNMLTIYHSVLENTEKKRDAEKKQNKSLIETMESIIQENCLLIVQLEKNV